MQAKVILLGVLMVEDIVIAKFGRDVAAGEERTMEGDGS